MIAFKEELKMESRVCTHPKYLSDVDDKVEHIKRYYGNDLPHEDELIQEFNPLNANPTKWPNILKQFVGKLPTNCLSVFGHFVNLALKGLSCGSNFGKKKKQKNRKQSQQHWNI